VIRNLIQLVSPYRPIRVSGTFWEKRYKDGAWDRLRTIEELARYSLIVGYVHYLNKGGSILDVGCGEGILYERLCKSNYSRYLGIDVSSVAIARACDKSNATNQFLSTRIEDFRTDEKFDIIIFNECLYYMEEPLKTLRHYESFLTKSGVFVISMYKTMGAWKVWKQFGNHYYIRDTVSVRNAKDECWTIKVLNRSMRNEPHPVS